jgi:hypothetical protein
MIDSEWMMDVASLGVMIVQKEAWNKHVVTMEKAHIINYPHSLHIPPLYFPPTADHRPPVFIQ